ncbi:MAG TPA: hypothetical protein VM513_05145 [Kofleriaceae bacterium]|jgi:hypothetical protein|nr:hypothetical protein [Kofleriaceae bacterium]
MPILRYLVLLLALCAATACSSDDTILVEPGASLLVVNDSDFTIIDVRLTPVDNPSFGANLLRGDVLFPGEELLLGVPCDFYDALVVDEDGIECRLFDLDLCFNDATWVIRNNTCSVFGAAAP